MPDKKTLVKRPALLKRDGLIFTPLESPVPLQRGFVTGPAIYGGDEIDKVSIPYRKGGVKAPSFLTGFTAIVILALFSLLKNESLPFCRPLLADILGEVDKMLENLHWLGHDSFRLDGAKTIYFDPWKLPKNSKKADIIFISHEHFDHFSIDDIGLISTKDTVIVTDKNVSKQLQGKISCKEIKPLSPTDKAQVGAITVEAVASYNINKEFHTKGSKKLGFIVTADGVSIYHAGDTDAIPEMKDYSCDIALLPVSGTYVMTAEEAAHAALVIKPKVAVPMHYGDIVGSVACAERFRSLLKDKIEVRILKKENTHSDPE